MTCPPPPEAARRPPIRHDWVAKSLAGVCAGIPLAMGCSGLLLILLNNQPPNVRVQFAMWLVVPVWLGVLASCFAARSGLRAWLWLIVMNLLVFGLLTVAKGH